jgi:hypothetical protein
MFSTSKPKFNFVQIRSRLIGRKDRGGLIKLFVSVVEICKITEIIFKSR